MKQIEIVTSFSFCHNHNYGIVSRLFGQIINVMGQALQMCQV